ncbi:MAG: hypothetical protein R3C05_28435 [Pirellulaceae bacterium]
MTPLHHRQANHPISAGATRLQPLHWLPLAALNLLRNPFGELTRADRVRAAVVDLAPFREILDTEMTAIQFLADCGRGKTTHLLAIANQFPESAYVYLPEDGRHPKIPDGDPLLIDEAQRLPWLVRRRTFRRGVRLVLGTHVDLRGPLRRAGYRVWTYHVGQNLSGRQLAEMLNRRIEIARLDRGPIPTISIEEADALIEQHSNDIRAIEDTLFDRFRQQAGQFHGEMRFND